MNNSLQESTNIRVLQDNKISELLDCSVDDLLVWAEERKIKICIKVQDLKGMLVVQLFETRTIAYVFMRTYEWGTHYKHNV
jgi:accessory gene regulator protein AgrB